jgi:hypothetical protein
MFSMIWQSLKNGWVDGSPRGDGPDKSTVRRAIARENLADKVIISRRERNPEARA